MAFDTLNDSGSLSADAAAPASRTQRILQTLGWTFFALSCFLLFTVLKLPETRIKNLVQGYISSALAPYGMSITMGEADLSLGFGLSYEMKDVLVNFPPPTPPLRLESLEITPSISALFLGDIAAHLQAEAVEGSLKASVSTDALSPGEAVSLSFDLDQLNIGKLGILPALASGLQGGLIASGSGTFSGNLASPNSLEGQVDLDLKKITIPQQSLMGFSIPKLGVSEGKVDLALDKGKVKLNQVKIGKAGTADDIVASLSGSANLGRRLDMSTVDLRADFNFSENVKKSFSLLDALLAAGRKPSGGYAFKLTGPVTGIMPTPVGGQ